MHLMVESHTHSYTNHAFGIKIIIQDSIFSSHESQLVMFNFHVPDGILQAIPL